MEPPKRQEEHPIGVFFLQNDSLQVEEFVVETFLYQCDLGPRLHTKECVNIERINRWKLII